MSAFDMLCGCKSCENETCVTLVVVVLGIVVMVAWVLVVMLVISRNHSASIWKALEHHMTSIGKFM